jgi:hypothetical protein
MKIICCFKNTRQQQLQKKEELEAKEDTTEHSSQDERSSQCDDVTSVFVTEMGTEKINSISQNCCFSEFYQFFGKLNECYNADENEFHKKFKELIQGYDNDKDEFVDMSQPRDAYYVVSEKWNYDKGVSDEETKRLGEDVILSPTATIRYMLKHGFRNKYFNPYSYRSMDTEVRGITLRQLRAIIPLIKRRCEEENWTRPIFDKDGKETEKEEAVTLENATLYDVNKYIIKPFTKYSQKSFVETLPSTKGTQPPRWFVR